MKLIYAFLKFTLPEFIVHTDVSLDYYQAVEYCESTGAKLALFEDENNFQCVSKTDKTYIFLTTNDLLSFWRSLVVLSLGSVVMI